MSFHSNYFGEFGGFAFLWEFLHFHLSGKQMEKKEQKPGEGEVYSALKLIKKSQAKFATGWRAGKPYLSQKGNVSPSESPKARS